MDTITLVIFLVAFLEFCIVFYYRSINKQQAEDIEMLVKQIREDKKFDRELEREEAKKAESRKQENIIYLSIIRCLLSNEKVTNSETLLLDDFPTQLNKTALDIFTATHKNLLT
jgi:hypothetical protein